MRARNYTKCPQQKAENFGYDIFVSSLDSAGNWSEPVSVPDGVNTAGNEVFPTLVDDILYFSSDARAGMGGLDIYGYNLKTQKIFLVMIVQKLL